MHATKKLLWIGVLLMTTASSFALEISSNTEPLLTISSQTGVDRYIDWELSKITPTLWIMSGRIDNVFLAEAKTVNNNREWQDLAAKYFTDPSTVRMSWQEVRDQMSDFVNYPLYNSTEATVSRVETNWNTGYLEFSITFPKGLTNNVSFKTGWNSTVVESNLSDSLTAANAMKKHVLWSENYDRWYVVFPSNLTASLGINNNLTFISYNSTIGNTSTRYYHNVQIVQGGIFDCVMQEPNATNSYIHCVYGTNAERYFLYARFNLTTANPYIVPNIQTVVYNSTDSLDDVETLSLAISNDNCLMALVSIEDDSLVTADEFQVQLFREDNGTVSTQNVCGDGKWNTTDRYTSSPLTVNNETGYNAVVPLRINTFGNGDAQLSYLNTDSLTAAQFRTRFYNYTSNTLGTTVTVHTDIEAAASYTRMMTLSGTSGGSVFYYTPDGSNTITAATISSKGSTIVTNTTGIGIMRSTTTSTSTGAMGGIVDLRSSSGTAPTLIFNNGSSASPFNVTRTNTTNITGNIYNVSTMVEAISVPATIANGGRFSSGFANSSCDVVTTGYFFNSTVSFISVITPFNTGNCPASSASTTTYINCASNPTININTDYNGTTVYFNGTGTTTVNANLSNATVYIRQNSCLVRRNNQARIETT